MSEKEKFFRVIQIHEQTEGGFLVQWRNTENGRMDSSKAIETEQGVMELLSKLLGDKRA